MGRTERASLKSHCCSGVEKEASAGRRSEVKRESPLRDRAVREQNSAF